MEEHSAERERGRERERERWAADREYMLES